MVIRVLSGPEMATLHQGLDAAFDEDSLAMMLSFRLDKKLRNYAGRGATFSEAIFKLIERANMEGWWPALLIAARNSAPGNAMLLEAEVNLLAKAKVPEDQGNLEKIVNLRSGFRDVDEFGRRLGQLANGICAVEDSRGGLGTGWLVAADIIITNYHVVSHLLPDGIDKLQCRFDFKVVDGVVNTGRTVSVMKKGCIAHRPFGKADVTVEQTDWSPDELDYALLRLAEPVGLQPVGAKPEPSAPVRGWIEVQSKPSSIEPSDQIWIFQHPQDLGYPSQPRLQPIKLSNGKVLEWAGEGIRLRHDARTLPGSSGSACCDDGLKVVALHQGGDPLDWPDYRGSYNQAIPLHRIVADLVARTESDGVELRTLDAFWDKAPPL
ncbi:serine protease [Mesorhizobium sp. B292B1B]|uniref:trypsin-like peptidase domain-containing protein n=1 Tax=unclassified Mesorhizobium TaxID=325217 RepID=UPI00112B3AF4|nr:MULTISPECIES: trypsin-like peptidase domain-containing protein [unclassified Mesorhizobium]MCA0012889.1 serine protease [Mesorhizobium sp. B294B1A1]MCA0037610.1 serine protease [Mesorhizobium sp. B292B1B]TPM50715.1 trypsin-like peptidase domain-containing protein [Mesorhizobium sp. B2-3-2]